MVRSALLSLFLVSACFGLSVTAQMPPQGNASVTVSVKIGVNNPGNNTGELKAEGTYTLAQNQVVDKVKIEYFSYTTVNGIPKMTFLRPTLTLIQQMESMQLLNSHRLPTKMHKEMIFIIKS